MGLTSLFLSQIELPSWLTPMARLIYTRKMNASGIKSPCPVQPKEYALVDQPQSSKSVPADSTLNCSSPHFDPATVPIEQVTQPKTKTSVLSDCATNMSTTCVSHSVVPETNHVTETQAITSALSGSLINTDSSTERRLSITDLLDQPPVKESRSKSRLQRKGKNRKEGSGWNMC